MQYISDYRACGKEGQYLYKKFQNNWTIGRITALIEDAPPCGYKIYSLVSVDQRPEKGEYKAPSFESIKTKYFSVSFNANGSVNIDDPQTKHHYYNLNIFEDAADDGDEYDYGPLLNEDLIYTYNTDAIIKKVMDNNVYTEVQADLDFFVPADLIENENKKRFRSNQKVALHLKTKYLVYKNISRIDIKTNVTNSAKSHRLRVLFPSDINANSSYADDHFMVMKRTVKLPKDDGWFQAAQGTYHCDAFVDLNDETRGLTICSRGLAEYEIIQTPSSFAQQGNAIALTLFRSVGWLSKHGHLGRKSGLNGPNLQTPGAQLLGHQFEFEYSIYPHKGNWEEANAYRTAHAYCYPPRWFSERHFLRNEKLSKALPLDFSFFRITNPLIVLSAIKCSDKVLGAKKGVIIRVFNPTDKTQKTEVVFSIPITQATLTNLLEQDQELLKIIENKKITIIVLPYKIITLLVNCKFE